MQNVLNHDVLFEKHFEEISRIPHGSGNEAGVADYLVQFAKDRGLWWHRDALHNVIIKKGGTEGYEYSPPVLMQAHTDMVCVKDKGVEHDFLRDPLKLVLEGRILRAEGTSLGADDIAAWPPSWPCWSGRASPIPPLRRFSPPRRRRACSEPRLWTIPSSPPGA